jgi:arylsulfatase A-like enzyme/Flp pilus assembly protein TadD
VVVGAVLAAAACRGGGPPPQVSHDLIFVTIDTLRADRLGVYGSPNVATPALDGIARAGALAPEATVHVALTRPSHVSLLTGLLPYQHGIRDNVSPALGSEIPTLATLLRPLGFRTGAFVSSIVLSKQSGLDRGFETYGDRFEAGGEGDDARFLNTLQKRGDLTLDEAVQWLERVPKQERVFLWLHLYDPHDPYEPPEPYATRYEGRPYDGEVAWTDELIRRLDAALERLGRREQALLVITADHGEGLGEHQETGHGFFVYQSTLRVPLIVRGPGISPGTRLPVTARGVDLPPTVLELLGVKPAVDVKFAGRSLAGALRGQESLLEEPTYAESLVPLLHFGWSDLRSLREGRFKYVEAPRPELYDLSEDPGETRDLAASQASRRDLMRAALGRHLEAERAQTRVAATGANTVPPELLEQLGALGYLGAGAPGPGSSPGADPKDRIEEFKSANRLIRQGLVKLREKSYAESVAAFRELLSRRIESFEVHYYLGRALAGLKRYAEALPHFEGAVRYLPSYGAAYDSLAQCHAARGDLQTALRVLERGRQSAPTYGPLPHREGEYRVRLGDRPGAIRAFEAALPLSPRNALLRMRLGELLRDAGELGRAAAVMREAVALEGTVASYWNSLGLVLGAHDELAEAEKAFREAVAREDTSALYVYNLGLALQRQGRGEEAIVHFRRAAELDPRFAPARDRLRELGPGKP